MNGFIEKLEVIEFDVSYNDISRSYIAMFNADRISEDAVREVIHNRDSHPEVIIMIKEQYLNIFFNGVANN